MKNLWRKWCLKVDRHNESLGYASAEECWSYSTIFLPFIMGLVFCALLIFLTALVKFDSVYKLKDLLVPVFIIVSGLFSGALGLNWKLYEPKKEK